MTEWHPFDTAPEGRSILIFQKKQDAHGVEGFYQECMIIGSFERYRRKDGVTILFVHPDGVSGHEMECEVERPTHWAEPPDKPT